jgi:hypothetical protein
MANKFSGVVRDSNGFVVSADIILYESDIEKAKSKTNNKGEFTITVTTELDPKKCKLIITKEDKELRSIENPQPTGVITTGELQITAQEGGFLELKSQYRGGEYFFDSLGLGSKNDPDLVKDNFDLNLIELGQLINICSQKLIPLDLVITGSESRIPNFDQESTSPTKGQPLPEKELAKRRVQYLNEHILTDLFKDQNIKTKYSKIKKEELIISGPESGNKNVDYTQYQYVSIKALPIRPTCTSVSVAQKAGENKTIPYVAPGSKYCRFSALQIPDRFGFNGYYLPYYSIEPSTQNVFTSVNNSYTPRDENGNLILFEKLPIIPELDYKKFFPLDVWGFFIFLFLYVKNNNSTKFLDETRPGLKLDYKVLTPEEKDKIIERFKKTLNKYYFVNPKALTKSTYNNIYKSTDILYNQTIFTSVIGLIEKFPKSFPNIQRGEQIIEITPTSTFGEIGNSITKMINGMDRVAIISVQPGTPTIDITNLEYNLRVNSEQQKLNPNIANGISSTPLQDLSVWSYCICDKQENMTSPDGRKF